MYKNSRFKIITRLILTLISLGLIFYDRVIAAYFIFTTLWVMIAIDFVTNKWRRNQG